MGLQLKNKLLIGGLILATLLAVGYLAKSTREASASPDFPDGMHWLCESCQHGFSTSREAFADWAEEHPDQALECPQCHKQTTEIARHCSLPECGKYYTQVNLVVDGTVCCPICRQPVP